MCDVVLKTIEGKVCFPRFDSFRVRIPLRRNVAIPTIVPTGVHLRFPTHLVHYSDNEYTNQQSPK